MRFWIIGRRKKAIEVLPSGLGIFHNSLTIQFDAEAQRKIASRDSRKTVVPGEVIDKDTDEI